MSMISVFCDHSKDILGDFQCKQFCLLLGQGDLTVGMYEEHYTCAIMRMIWNAVDHRNCDILWQKMFCL